jgi:hypothetical protein
MDVNVVSLPAPENGFRCLRLRSVTGMVARTERGVARATIGSGAGRPSLLHHRQPLLGRTGTMFSLERKLWLP